MSESVPLYYKPSLITRDVYFVAFVKIANWLQTYCLFILEVRSCFSSVILAFDDLRGYMMFFFTYKANITTVPCYRFSRNEREMIPRIVRKRHNVKMIRILGLDAICLH